MLLYFIRHGDPDYENDCLTARGKLQAAALSKRLAAALPDKIYTSPMGRAIETAMPTCVLTGKKYTVLPWAREINAKTDYPDGEERSLAYLPNVMIRREENIDLGYDRMFEAGGFRDSGIKEKFDNLIDNFRAFLEEQGFTEENGVYRQTRENKEKIMIFCHGNMARSVEAYLLHIPIHLMWAGFGFSHTGVTIIKLDAGEGELCAPKCFCHCDLSHLYAEGIPLIYNNRFLI